MGTHHRGTEREKKALDAYIKLLRASDSLAAALAPQVHAAGLTFSQFGCLEALFHLGPLCPREIGRKLLRSPGNVTTLLDNLERAGMVRRVRDREDRRYVTVHLTDAGRSLMRGLFPRHANRVAFLLSSLTSGEISDLARICKKLGLAASAHPRTRRSAAPAES